MRISLSKSEPIPLLHFPRISNRFDSQKDTLTKSWTSTSRKPTHRLIWTIADKWCSNMQAISLQAGRARATLVWQTAQRFHLLLERFFNRLLSSVRGQQNKEGGWALLGSRVGKNQTLQASQDLVQDWRWFQEVHLWRPCSSSFGQNGYVDRPNWAAWQIGRGRGRKEGGEQNYLVKGGGKEYCKEVNICNCDKWAPWPHEFVAITTTFKDPMHLLLCKSMISHSFSSPKRW